MSVLVSIPEGDRRRVVSAAGLLASDKDGEVIAAARAVCRLLKPYGITPSNLIASALKPQPDVFPTDMRGSNAPPFNHRRIARQCLTASILNDWERQFLTNIAEQRSLTDRQREKLQAIREKVGRGYGQ